MSVISLIFGLAFLSLSNAQLIELFELSVIHFNDFHARFEETNSAGGSCKDAECIGGFSRLYHQIMEMKAENPDAVVLDAGDDFQGTIWYTLGKWNVTQEFMNTLPIDASTIGNHEFDDGVEGVVPYINSLNHPVVVSNIDDSMEPSFQSSKYTKSTVIERNGKKIGIIGVILSSCASISSTGDLVFGLESPAVNEEAERLVREEGVFTNIVLSHSGYDTDKQIAANASEKISLIVGGHSHSFLYTGNDKPGPDNVAGPYPTVVKSKNDRYVLITQASAYCKYLGNITIYLDENGEIADYSGAPIFLSSDIPKDETIDKMLEPWQKIMDAQGEVVLGSSLVTLSKTGCYYKECTLGNLVTDAFVYAFTKNAPVGAWTSVAIALMNPGGLRTDIEIGNISYADMVTAQPFGNTVDVLEIEGKYLRDAFEWNTGSYYYGRVYSDLKLFQVSGVRVVYNLTRPAGQQVQSIKVRCQNCTVPVYEPLEDDTIYKVATCSYVTQGGDSYTVLTENMKNLVTGSLDMEVFQEYLAHRSPLFQEEEERIVVYGDENVVVRNMDT